MQRGVLSAAESARTYPSAALAVTTTSPSSARVYRTAARRGQGSGCTDDEKGVDMATAIGRDEVRREMDSGRAQLVEVLPAEEYEDEHLPGAVNIPLKDFGPESVASLDRARPVVVYCYDHE